MQLIQGNCLEKLKDIPDGTVDMILNDPPYGTTACKWDTIIPLEPMWEQLKRVIKPNGAIVMTASQPFTTTLIASNMKMFKYCWVWEKTAATGHLSAKKRPMKCHEDIIVFYCDQPLYNPQMTHGHERKTTFRKKEVGTEIYSPNTKDTSYNSTSRYPRTIQMFAKDNRLKKDHPTQKPVALMEYLIRTYTNEGETVLDFTMGSGTTGVACVNACRNFIGIELDETYFKIAKDRIEGTNPLFNFPSPSGH